MAARLDTNLSRLLLDEGLASMESLEDATQQQLIHGGALDTLLLELGVVDEATVSAALARAWGTPPVDTSRLVVSAEDAHRWLPERIAVSLALCPFREDGERLHVLVSAPVDRALLDEVGALVQRPLVPHVVPEVRLWEQLRRAYDTPVDERLMSLSRHLEKRAADVASSSALAVAVTRPPDLEETRWDLVEALAHLAAQEHRAGIADVAVRYARQFLPFAAIFGVRHGVAVGWRRSGPAEGPQFENVTLPVPRGSVLAQVLDSPSPLLGKPPITDGNAAFFGWLGRRRPRTALLIPIIVAKRPVAVLAADGGVRAQTFDALSDLVAFGARLGAAFEALLRARHRAHPEIFDEDARAKATPEASTGGAPPAPDESAHVDEARRAEPRAGRDGTSPFARGYVAPKSRAPLEPAPAALALSADGAWQLVMERRAVSTVPPASTPPDAEAEPTASANAPASATMGIEAGASTPGDDDVRAFEDVPSSSEIASFEKGPTSTEIASFDRGDTPRPSEDANDRDGARVVVGALVADVAALPPDEPSGVSPAHALAVDDELSGVTGMFRILPRDSGDVDEAAFTAAVAWQETKRGAVDDVDRVADALDRLETGGFQNLLERDHGGAVPPTVAPASAGATRADDDASSTWTKALVDTVAHGRQGGVAETSDEPVLADDDGWEDVVLDRAYAAALHAPPAGHAPPHGSTGDGTGDEATATRTRDEDASGDGAPDDDDEAADEESVDGGELDDDEVDALVDEASRRASGAEPKAAPVPDLDDEAALPALPGSLLVEPAAHASSSSTSSATEITAAPPAPPDDDDEPPAVAASPSELVAMLDSLSAERIAEARSALVALGAAAVPALTSAFPGRLLVDPFAHDVKIERSADLGPLIEVCEALGSVGLDAAIPHLDSRFPAHRFAATFLFVVVPDERAIDLVRPRLHDFEAQIRTIAAAALAHFMAHPRFVSVLTHLRQRLGAPSHEARERAAILLGAFRDVASIPALIPLLDERGALGDAAHAALVRITLQDHGPKPRVWEKWWERARQRTRIDWLIDALRHKERDIRFVASMELVEIAGHDFGYHCEQGRRDREDAVKRVEAWWRDERAAIGL